VKYFAPTARRHELRGVDRVQVIAELPQRRLRNLLGMQGDLLGVNGARATVRFPTGQFIVPIASIAPVVESVQ
jgi:hypothetical protein